MKYLLSAALCVTLLTGCVVRQLDGFKKNEASHDYAAIEKARIAPACFAAAPGADECPQLTEIQGRACMTLALGEAAPGAACPPATASARSRLQCAARDFAVARGGEHFSSDDRAEMTEMRARALYCDATLGSRADGLPAAREAARELDTLPENPRRDQLAAAAALYQANSEELASAERCSAAHLAATRAARGLKNNPSDEIEQGLRATQAHAESVAKHLTGCEG